MSWWVIGLILLLAPGISSALPPTSFLYQLQNIDVAQVAASPYDLVVSDYSHDGSAAGKLTTAEVTELRSGGARTALAYLSIGEAETYRYYWQPGWAPGSPAWLGPSNPRWPDNYKVRYWDPNWQAIIFGSPGAYLDQIIAQGFDGAYLDVVDAFEFWGPDGNNERPDAAQDMVDFVKALTGYARAQRPGFLVFPQNGSQLSVVDATYVGTVDGIGAEDTWTVGNRRQARYHTDHVTAWLDLFRDAGKTVLAIDYPTVTRRTDEFYARAEARGYLPSNPPRNLDRYVLNPMHPPSPAPSVTLTAPDDGSDVSAGTTPTFTWAASGDAVAFQVWFSGNDSFRKLLILPSPASYLTSPSFTPDSTTWARILRLAAKNGYGAIYWWVRALDANAHVRASRARRLVRLHENVSTTVFYVGEPASPENGFIANDDSAWDECWKERYGGIDDPANRNGYWPAGFTPLENPFYVALPYDDLDTSGNRRWNVPEVVPWAKTQSFAADVSVVKNRWVKIIANGNTCYAQWEDVGPFKTNDVRYVFGTARPRSSANAHAGLDVSPAVQTCLGIAYDITPTNWRFVEASEVPAGPWTQIVTTSQLNFNPLACP